MMKRKFQGPMVRTTAKLILIIFGPAMILLRLYKKGFKINFPIRKIFSKK